jgi:integrin beta 3
MTTMTKGLAIMRRQETQKAMSARANPSGQHMPAQSPFDILAEELGAVAGRVERESMLRIEAAVSDVRRIDAERELRFSNLERQVEDVIARVKDGERGHDGANGADGRDGAPGTDGRDGAAGLDGKDGIAGRDGLDGVNGKDGVDGLQGPQGPSGADGKDGAAGRDGANGADGQQGERGLPGERGEAGPAPTAEDIDAAVARYFAANPVQAGAPGERGPAGERGEQGEQGERGADGVDGRDGADGIPGPRGEAGAPGKLPTVQVWEDRVYYEGEVATINGGTFQALRDTGRSPPHDDWHCIAAAGVNGRDGASFAIRGTHAAEETYFEFDVVALNGASFVAKRNDPGPCPGDGWQMLSMQGKRGNPGERGPQGPRGERGDAGSPVVAFEVDESGVVVLTNGDGTTAEADLYPLLTKLAR